MPEENMTRKQNNLMDKELASGRALRALKRELMRRLVLLPASDGVWQAIDGLLQERFARKLSEDFGKLWKNTTTGRVKVSRVRPPGEDWYEVIGGLNEGRK